MAGMILAKKFIFRSFPQTQSLFLGSSSSSSTHKYFSIATLFTTSDKVEKLAETGERTTMMSQKVKHKAAELKDRTKAEKRSKDTGSRSVTTDKAKQGSYKVSESSTQNVKQGKTNCRDGFYVPAEKLDSNTNNDMAGKTDQEDKEKEKHWKKPPEGCHVLSADGSAREDIAGIGGLIRHENGSIVAAFAAGIPTAPIPVIEIKAIVEGVKMAMTNRVTKLIINSDSMHPCEARDDINLLNSMKGSFTRFEVIHVCRELNRPADFLASYCKNEGTLVVFNSVNSPQRLKDLAAQDAATGSRCN